jgi:hypothetical protein
MRKESSPGRQFTHINNVLHSSRLAANTQRSSYAGNTIQKGFGTLHPQMDDVRHIAEVRNGPCDGVLTDAEVRQLGQVVELRGDHTFHEIKSVKVGFINEGTAPNLNGT